MAELSFLARRYDTQEAVCIALAGGQLARIERAAPQALESQAAERLPLVAPGFVDLQVNGYGGCEFTSAELSADDLRLVAQAMDRFGATCWLATLTTHSFDVLHRAAGAIAAACQTDAELAQRIAGIHLEGPYVSAQDGPRGAHPRAFCRQPDFDEFERLQEAAGGRIRLLTLSPEYEGAAAFISRAVASGVLIGIGHTAATAVQIRAAVDAGARLSTHLGNGCHALLPRHHNYLWAQLAEDRLCASLICDGHHLPPEVVKSFVRAKTPARCVLVSDLVAQAGLAPGRYRGGLGEVEMRADGRLVVAGQTEMMAGATAPIGTGVANVMQFAGVTLAEAVDMASRRPAQLLGLPGGRLEVGAPADLVLFDLPEQTGERAGRGLHVRATIKAGRVVFGALVQV